MGVCLTLTKHTKMNTISGTIDSHTDHKLVCISSVFFATNLLMFFN